ncbi:MAG TPA: nucleotidyltransferase family protein, partial [Candidatus Methanoperedens sp.]|nr:nucleotidyltransferase family protein [Candidatus Methanoperedens sp.]
ACSCRSCGWRRMSGRAGRAQPTELLFALARLRPAPGAVEELVGLLRGNRAPGGDAAAVLRQARETGVAPLLYRHLAGAAAVPQGVLRELGRSYLENVRWNRECLGEAAGILAALRAAGIAAIPLKGAVGALTLLGDEGLYAGGDIDLLVRRRDLESAIGTLWSLGYREGPVALRDDLAASYHHCLVRGRFWVELHWNLVEQPFQADPDFWWEDAAPCRTPAGDAWALAPEKLLLALIRRLFARGFSPLRLFVLPVAVANGGAGPLDWQRFLGAARRCGMERVSRFALALMQERLGAEVPESVAAPGRAHRRLRARLERALLGAAPIRQPTRLRLLLLCDSAVQVQGTVARRLFPPVAEIRWRYGEAARGWRLPALYLLNPLLALLEPETRARLTGRPAPPAGCPARGGAVR